VLDRAECRQMTKDSLIEMKQHLPKLLTALTDDILSLTNAETKNITMGAYMLVWLFAMLS